MNLITAYGSFKRKTSSVSCGFSPYFSTGDGKPRNAVGFTSTYGSLGSSAGPLPFSFDIQNGVCGNGNGDVSFRIDSSAAGKIRRSAYSGSMQAMRCDFGTERRRQISFIEKHWAGCFLPAKRARCLCRRSHPASVFSTHSLRYWRPSIDL